MNAKSQRSKFDGLTSIAKKVYECVPAQESWSITRISDEMIRKGLTPNKRMIEGCLNSLKDSGLVLESPPGHFKAIVLKTKKSSSPSYPDPFKDWEMEPKQEPIVKAEKPVLEVVHTAPKNPLDTLSEIANSVDAALRQVNNVTITLNSLKKDIEDAALEITAQMESTEEKFKQFRQLQSLLKSLGE